MGLSLVSVPVFLDTNTQPAHLLKQWVRTYHYGHILMPTIAIGTSLLYAYAATSRRKARRRWTIYAAAAAVTLSLIPFTWMALTPTNNILFRLEGEAAEAMGLTTLDYVQELVTKWSRLHFVRSVFPLAGAALGFSGLLKEVALES